jgi:hypothetical protein
VSHRGRLRLIRHRLLAIDWDFRLRLLAIDGHFRPIRRLHIILRLLLLPEIALCGWRCYRTNHCRTSNKLILPLRKGGCRLRRHMLRDNLAVDNRRRRSN